MYAVHMDTHHQLIILRPPTREHPARSVDRAHLAEVLGAAVPVIAYAEDERGRLVFPADPEGHRLASCLAAQLTLCAAGLWPV